MQGRTSFKKKRDIILSDKRTKNESRNGLLRPMKYSSVVRLYLPTLEVQFQLVGLWVGQRFLENGLSIRVRLHTILLSTFLRPHFYRTIKSCGFSHGFINPFTFLHRKNKHNSYFPAKYILPHHNQEKNNLLDLINSKIKGESNKSNLWKNHSGKCIFLRPISKFKQLTIQVTCAIVSWDMGIRRRG